MSRGKSTLDVKGAKKKRKKEFRKSRVEKNESTKTQSGQSYCGQCTWFIVPKGRSTKTCRTLRGVQEDSLSCEEFEPRGPGLKTISELKQDPFIDRLKKLLAKRKLRVDPALLKEVRSYLVFRKETQDTIERPVPERIDNMKDLQCLEGFFEETQAYRDRVTEILMDLAVIHRKLKDLWLYANAWCNEHPVITEGLRTADQRDAVIATILKPLHERYSYVKMLQRVCELADRNLANTHFALKEQKDTAAIHLSKLRSS